jgi:hypothetical protein
MTVPYVPLSHPFVKRLIGTLRREFFEHVPFFNTRDLERKLLDFKGYCNGHRVHDALGGTTPGLKSGEARPKVVNPDDHRGRHHSRGSYELPTVAKALIRHGQSALRS